jgi:hypothetical protein
LNNNFKKRLRNKFKIDSLLNIPKVNIPEVNIPEVN